MKEIDLQKILDYKFTFSKEKRKIIIQYQLMNFACPICGDSEKDMSKKRCIYDLSINMILCYNCSYRSRSEKFVQKYSFLFRKNKLKMLKNFLEE